MIKTIQYQEKQIHYRVVGKGSPIVLLHGFGEDSTIWDSQAKFLQKKYKLIIPDLPGSGQSELLAETRMESMAEVVNAIIEKEIHKAEKIKLIGHSMGGYIILAFMEKYDELVDGFGLFHSTAFADSEEKKIARKKSIDFIQQHGAYEFLKTSIPNLFAAKNHENKKEEIQKLIAQGHNFSAQALVSYYEAMITRPDRTMILKNTKVPVLFVMGVYDNAAPVKDMLQQCYLPEKSYIHIFQNAGHMGMLEEVEKSNRVFENFIADNSNE